MDKNSYLNLLSTRNSQRENLVKLLDGVHVYDDSGTDIGTNGILDLGEGAGTFNETICDAFDIDNAAGDQLDVLGDLIGASRLLPVIPSAGESRSMSDDEYRLVLKLKAAQNTWDGTLKHMAEIYRDVFGDIASVIFEDNQNMTVEITVLSGLTTRESKVLAASGAFLVPAGVRKTITAQVDSESVPMYIGACVIAEEIDDYSRMHGLTTDIVETMLVRDLEKKTVTEIEDV